MNKRRQKIFIIIPAYNEESSIGKVVNDVAKHATKVIVVDDGSTDQTADNVKNRKAVVIKHMCNLGQGAALQTGFDYAKYKNADVAVTFDADGQQNPADIPKLIKKLNEMNADVVLGSRFLGNTKNIPFTKYITLKIGILFTNILSNLNLTDTHNGFRVFTKAAIVKIEIKHNRMAHASEIIEEIRKNKLKYIEAPVNINYNKYSMQKGQSISNSINILIDLLFNKLN